MTGLQPGIRRAAALGAAIASSEDAAALTPGDPSSDRPHKALPALQPHSPLQGFRVLAIGLATAPRAGRWAG